MIHVKILICIVMPTKVLCHRLFYKICPRLFIISIHIGGVLKSGNRSVDNAILDMTQTATMRDSRILGHSVLTELGKLNQLHKGRVDEANFAVLRAPDIPSILVETAFLSNPTEERLLGSDSFRRQCADAIATGIQKYVNNAVLRRG